MRCIVKRPGHPAWARLSLAASLLVSGCIAGCDGPGDGDRTRLLRIWSRTSHAEQVSVSSDESQVVIFTGGLDQRVVCFDVDPWRKKWSRRVGDDFSGGASVAWSSGEVVVFGDNCGASGVLAADGRVRVPFRSTGLRCSERIVSAPLGARVGVGQGRSSRGWAQGEIHDWRREDPAARRSLFFSGRGSEGVRACMAFGSSGSSRRCGRQPWLRLGRRHGEAPLERGAAGDGRPSGLAGRRSNRHGEPRGPLDRVASRERAGRLEEAARRAAVLHPGMVRGRAAVRPGGRQDGACVRVGRTTARDRLLGRA
jgi:hypothetical protein